MLIILENPMMRNNKYQLGRKTNYKIGILLIPINSYEGLCGTKLRVYPIKNK